MHMALKARKWTRADLDRLPDDGNRYEVIRGELFVTPPPAAAHQSIVEGFGRRVQPYVWAQQLGQVHFPRSVLMFDKSVAEPDMMVLPLGRLTNWEQIPTPLLVMEVASDSTVRRDRVAKRAYYMDAGVSEYWIVDGSQRTVTAIRPGEADNVVSSELQWQPSGAAEALRIELVTLFEEALGSSTPKP
jgi:Uma2 family endonuclease